jgi:site-specific DNA-cytosine methylase
MSGASSQESEDSTSALNERDTGSSSNARRTSTADESSPDIGRESRALRTFDAWNQSETGKVTMTLGSQQQGREGVNSTPLIFSAEDSPAKTSPSLADERDSKESAPPSSSSSQGSQMTFSGAEDGSSLRTYPDSFPPTVDEISPSYSRRWPSSGFTTSPGECWTADTSECPSEGAVSSSLPDALEGDVHPRFYLSQRAAAGILRRAERRGRELPIALRSALSNLARDGREIQRQTRQPEDNSSVRRLTPTECERLQGFPDGHTWVPSTGKAGAM